jgi:hypothetical protein
MKKIGGLRGTALKNVSEFGFGWRTKVSSSLIYCLLHQLDGGRKITLEDTLIFHTKLSQNVLRAVPRKPPIFFIFFP